MTRKISNKLTILCIAVVSLSLSYVNSQGKHATPNDGGNIPVMENIPVTDELDPNNDVVLTEEETE